MPADENSSPSVRLARGDRFPDFVAEALDGQPRRFYSFAGGRPTLVIFDDSLDAWSEVLERLDRHAVPCVQITSKTTSSSRGPQQTLVDDDGTLSDHFAITEPVAVLLNRNLRVVHCFGADASADRVADLAVDEGEGHPPIIRAQAPVLLVDEVLPPAVCERLVEQSSGPGERTGVHDTGGGAHADVVDTGRKRRTDHPLGPDDVSALTTLVGRRLLPEVRRAFQFGGNRFEGFKLVRYTADDSGFFAAHRDNLAPATAHRRFAVTLLLNDEFEGGELRFPEYGDSLYRPPVRGAIVFSASLLHEVTPVTRGQRHAVLTFIYGAGDRSTTDT